MNRNKMILGAWVLGLLFPIEMMAKTSCTDNSTRLWYNAPAQQWLEALPIGNSSGRYGVWRNHGRKYPVE